MSFAGKTAVVTGAGGGMGFQIARALMAESATVFGIDLKDRPAGFDAAYRQGDITDDGFVAGAMSEVAEQTGRLDYLVNAAGVLLFGEDRSLVDVDLKVWDRVIRINLTGSMLTARHAVPLMQKTGAGAMVHFSSIQCLRGDDQPQDAYQVAKAGVIALSKSIAVQFAKDGIRSNVILPGGTDSPMQARWTRDPELKAKIAAGVPLGRVGTTEDMAGACLFLLSDQAGFVTGTELIVDGGRTALP